MENEERNLVVLSAKNNEKSNIIKVLHFFMRSCFKKFALKNLFVYIPCNFVLEKDCGMFLLVSVFLFSFFFSQNVWAKTIVIEEIKIEGTVQKPEVMTFLSRARFSYRTLDLNVSFLEDVEKAVLVDDAF